MGIMFSRLLNNRVDDMVGLLQLQGGCLRQMLASRACGVRINGHCLVSHIQVWQRHCAVLRLDHSRVRQEPDFHLYG